MSEEKKERVNEDEVKEQKTSVDDYKQEEVEDEDISPHPDISIDLVKEWKKKYDKIFVVYDPASGKPYVYRSFNYHEFKKLRADIVERIRTENEQPNDDIIKEEALKRYVLWPTNFKEMMEDPNATDKDGNHLPAGIPYIIGDQLMKVSGFLEIEPYII